MSSNSIEINLTTAEVEKAMQEYLDRRYHFEHRPKVQSVEFHSMRAGPSLSDRNMSSSLTVRATTPGEDQFTEMADTKP